MVVIENVRLDGVMQAPGCPDDDPSDGFAHGGWAVSFEMGAETLGEDLEPGAAALLFGRRTYTVRALMRQDLLDVLILRIHPLVLGSGRRLFDDRHAPLQLVDQATTSTGVIAATYVPERSA